MSRVRMVARDWAELALAELVLAELAAVAALEALAEVLALEVPLTRFIKSLTNWSASLCSDDVAPPPPWRWWWRRAC